VDKWTPKACMARAKKPAAQAMCHPDRAAYAHGLCRKCVDSIRWGGRLKNLPTTLSAEMRKMAEEAAGKVQRYKKNPERAAHFRTSRESVSAFVAGVAVKNALDMERTVQELRPQLPPAQVAETAQTLQSDPNVKAAIEKALEKRGLDEASKAHFVSILWRYAESIDLSDEKKTLAAWRILGRGFIGEKLEVDKPEALPLAGLESGLQRMGLGDDVVARLGPAPATNIDEDEERATFDA
jgi:hypothetical protein